MLVPIKAYSLQVKCEKSEDGKHMLCNSFLRERGTDFLIPDRIIHLFDATDELATANKDGINKHGRWYQLMLASAPNLNIYVNEDDLDLETLGKLV